MFQPEDAGGITQRAYEVMEKASRKSATYKHLVDVGDEKKAEAYAKENEAEIGMGQSAASMRAQLDQLSNAIRTVKERRLPAGMTPAEFAAQKRQQLTELQQARAQLAKDFTASLAEIKRQSSR
jgi:DNA anti-recombination protein RmuC